MMHRNFTSLFLFCVTCFVLPLTASATPITVPTDLNPGDTYRLVFVTSTTGDATSPNITDYNSFVAAVAAGVPELAALGTTWKVIGGTTSLAARDNTGTNPNVATGYPIYRLDDLRIANNNADLWDATVAQPIGVLESGELSSNAGIWTGSQTDGTIAASAFGSDSVQFGINDAVDQTWINQGAFGNVTIPRPFYAISGELTVVPEPSAFLLVCIGATSVAGWGLRSRRHRKRQ